MFFFFSIHFLGCQACEWLGNACGTVPQVGKAVIIIYIQAECLGPLVFHSSVALGSRFMVTVSETQHVGRVILFYSSEKKNKIWWCLISVCDKHNALSLCFMLYILMLCLCFQLGGLTPLHIAASIPGEEGVQIMQYLLNSVLDLDARAEDGNEVYGPDKVSCFLISSSFSC